MTTHLANTSNAANSLNAGEGSAVDTAGRSASTALLKVGEGVDALEASLGAVDGASRVGGGAERASLTESAAGARAGASLGDDGGSKLAGADSGRLGNADEAVNAGKVGIAGAVLVKELAGVALDGTLVAVAREAVRAYSTSANPSKKGHRAPTRTSIGQ